MAENKSVSEAERVIAYINDKIAAGELIVGSKLPTERALAEELEIGRNSAREAMSILSGMGIVERRQGSGSYISKDAKKSITQIISMTLALGRISLNDIIEFRKMTELMLADALIKNGLTPEQSDGFTESLNHINTYAENLSTENLADILMWDDRLHETMLTATDNPMMITIDEAIAKGYGPVVKKIIMHSDIELIRQIVQTRSTMHQELVKKNLIGALETIVYHYELVEKLIKN